QCSRAIKVKSPQALVCRNAGRATSSTRSDTGSTSVEVIGLVGAEAGRICSDSFRLLVIAPVMPPTSTYTLIRRVSFDWSATTISRRPFCARQFNSCISVNHSPPPQSHGDGRILRHADLAGVAH